MYFGSEDFSTRAVPFPWPLVPLYLSDGICAGLSPELLLVSTSKGIRSACGQS